MMGRNTMWTQSLLISLILKPMNLPIITLLIRLIQSRRKKYKHYQNTNIADFFKFTTIINKETF